jgi:membrane protein
MTLEALKEKFTGSISLLVRTTNHMLEDQGYRIAAEASFYLIFSIFPLLFLLFAALGYFTTPDVSNQLALDLGNILSTYVPDLTLETLLENLETMIEKYRERDIFFALILFTWPASNVFYAYVDAIGKAYSVPENRGYFELRLLSMVLLFVSGFIIFTTSFIFSTLPLAMRWLNSYLSHNWWVFGILIARYLGSLILIMPCVALLYRYGPDVKQRSRLIIWPGALVATTLWILFSQLFGLYLKYVDTYRALYGTLGSAMLLLLWMYLASLAIVFGAEFNFTLMSQKADS